MKTLLTLALTLTAASLATAGDTAPADMHLFLLAGQSNMAGRGEIDPTDNEALANVFVLDATGEWEPAIEPYHYDKSFAAAGLARSFAEAYLRDHPGTVIGFIPTACGGSPVSAWQPGIYFEATDSHPWDDAVGRLSIARKHGTLKGVLWHQGESDSHPALAPAYQSALVDLIQRFHTDLTVGNVPIILGQIGRFEGKPWGEPNLTIDRSIRAVAREQARVGFVSAEGLTAKPDGIHFNTASLREFGRRYYVEFQRVASTSDTP
ncbi:sialate O-acetylesterase [Synoicihabitans lomoniglobus]|uniref:Sialate O-acetylesterase n=1 Tax=Synoicihabitans lomoniglobus TaxID=2909285 RepID=A0AAF0CRP4_9BACT|nr:sialate O-acetylesterase [Opitutaceae bacterium LMO-M01]WED66741.1 sialate O-acetylesterase [Opitutaceae bacterium LMO-M01]